jgi:hypothetical protein
VACAPDRLRMGPTTCDFFFDRMHVELEIKDSKCTETTRKWIFAIFLKIEK